MSQSTDPALGINSWLEDELYHQYQFDRRSVDQGWTEFFQNSSSNGGVAAVQSPPDAAPAASDGVTREPQPAAPATSDVVPEAPQAAQPDAPAAPAPPPPCSGDYACHDQGCCSQPQRFRRNRKRLWLAQANNLSLCGAPRLESPRTWLRAFRFRSRPLNGRFLFGLSKKIGTSSTSSGL